MMRTLRPGDIETCMLGIFRMTVDEKLDSKEVCGIEKL